MASSAAEEPGSKTAEGDQKDVDNTQLKPGYFQRLPVELQVAIFTESIQKPSVHTFKVVKVPRFTEWTIKLRPLPKRTDKSGYRYLHELKQVCSSAHLAVEGSSIAKGSVRFPRLANRVDVSTDLFVLESYQPRFLGLRDPLEYASWDPDDPMNFRLNFGLFDRGGFMPAINRVDVGWKARGMRKIATFLHSNVRQHQVTDSYTSFVCSVDGACSQQHPSSACPASLSGYIDAMKDIETFYLIIPHRRSTRYYQKAVNYMAMVFSGEITRRQSDGDLETFYDMGSTYMEISKSLLRRFPEIHPATAEAFKLIYKVKFYLCRRLMGGEWNTTSARRQEIKFRVLLQIPKDR